MSFNDGRRWWTGRWLGAMALAVSGCGVAADFLIAQRCAERSSELVLKTVAARVAAGIRSDDGRPRRDAGVAPVRMERAASNPIRYVVRTNRGDLVTGDPLLVADPVAPTGFDPRRGPRPHAFTEVFDQDAKTFVVTVAESDARHASAVWSLFRQLLLPTLLLPGTFALFAWLVVRNELRSSR